MKKSLIIIFLTIFLLTIVYAQETNNQNNLDQIGNKIDTDNIKITKETTKNITDSFKTKSN